MNIIKLLCCMLVPVFLFLSGATYAGDKTASVADTSAASTTPPAVTSTADKPSTSDAASNDADDDDDDDDYEQTKTSDKDPLEGFNRAMFTFNEKLDEWILKPIATLYNKIMPKPLNKGIHNVFYNLNTVTTIADDLLQANFYQATNDLWRVGINTTVGIGGLFDVAERMELEPFQNDFGLTLARWGWQDSTYLVLPFFGPNTIRDGIVGLPVDYFALSVYPYIQPERTRYQIYALGVIDKRAQLLTFQEVLEEAALDKYVFIRNAYRQRRAFQINQVNHLGLKDQLTTTDQALPPLASENYDE